MRLSARTVATVLAAMAIGMAVAIGIDGWPGSSSQPPSLIGFPDCEAIGAGLVRQPTTAWSSLGFVVVGIWVAGDRRLPLRSATTLFGLTISAVGIGSFLGHAAQTEWARALDSGAIKVMLSAFATYSIASLREWDTRRLFTAWTGLSIGVLAIEAVWPGSARLLLGALVVATVALAVAATSPAAQRCLIGGLGLLAAGWAAWWLGRRGAALCSPAAVFQLHGLWHILAAAGIASVYQAYRSETP
jgi:hypothetical protein